jgi:hypothetical protein
MYSNNDPFYWGEVQSTMKPAMLVSIFPGTDGDSGLAAVDKKIIILAKAKKWISLDTFNAPS